MTDPAESAERSGATPVRPPPRPSLPEARASVPSAPPLLPAPPRTSAPPATSLAGTPQQHVETRRQPVVHVPRSGEGSLVAGDVDRPIDERGKLMAVLLGMAIGAVLYGITVVIILVMRR